MAIELIVGAVRGLEKTAVHAFEELAAGTKVEMKIGLEEFEEIVPSGKKWTGKMGLFVREDDA